MLKQYLLSICIPSYNRADYLKRNLKFISKIIQKSSVEIVISDDASTDGSGDVINNFVRDNADIRVVFNVNKKNIGFDKNILRMVSLASGRFCWLLGDDDRPSKSSIKKIINIINRYPNLSLIHLNYSRYDNVLKKTTAEKMINGINRDINFGKSDEFYFMPIKDSYFKFLGTHTITMSSDVINRRRWASVVRGVKKFIGHNFIHSFIIANIIRSDNSVYFVARPQVQYLSNNHRVWPNDIWKDYNSILLDYLLSLGYSKDKVEFMRRQQSEYEKRESISKNIIISRLYFFALKMYNWLLKWYESGKNTTKRS